jgi:hypothetical protein
LIDFRRIAPLIGLTSGLVVSGGGFQANLGWLGDSGAGVATLRL